MVMSRNRVDFSRQPDCLQAYLDGLTEVAGRADRVVPMENYTKGLMLSIERKSVEPMAARLAPGNVRQMLQSLHHIVADVAWSDNSLLKQVRRQVLPAIKRKHALAAWIVDDTGLPKKGIHSVGVARQYCGQPGKQENCRVAVSVSLATEQASIPATYRLYLPEIWADEAKRRKQVACLRRLVSRPSRRWRWSRSDHWSIKMCREAWCWPMPPMETTTTFARVSRPWVFPMQSGSNPQLRSGLRALNRSRPALGAKWGVHHGSCGGISNISPFRPKSSSCA